MGLAGIVVGEGEQERVRRRGKDVRVRRASSWARIAMSARQRTV